MWKRLIPIVFACLLNLLETNPYPPQKILKQTGEGFNISFSIIICKGQNEKYFIQKEKETK